MYIQFIFKLSDNRNSSRIRASFWSWRLSDGVHDVAVLLLLLNVDLLPCTLLIICQQRMTLLFLLLILGRIAAIARCYTDGVA